MAETELPAKTTSELNVGKDKISAITFFVSTTIAYFANKSSDESTRKLYTDLAPAIGLITALVLQSIAKQIFYWRGNSEISGYITDLKKERLNAAFSRKRVIDADIAEWNDLLKQRRKAHLL